MIISDSDRVSRTLYTCSCEPTCLIMYLSMHTAAAVLSIYVVPTPVAHLLHTYGLSMRNAPPPQLLPAYPPCLHLCVHWAATGEQVHPQVRSEGKLPL